MDLSLANLGLLTLNAAISVLSYVGLDVWPPVVSGDELLGFVATWVSCCDSIMMGSNDVLMKLLIFGDINLFLPFDQAVRG